MPPWRPRKARRWVPCDLGGRCGVYLSPGQARRRVGCYPGGSRHGGSVKPTRGAQPQSAPGGRSALLAPGRTEAGAYVTCGCHPAQTRDRHRRAPQSIHRASIVHRPWRGHLTVSLLVIVVTRHSEARFDMATSASRSCPALVPALLSGRPLPEGSASSQASPGNRSSLRYLGQQKKPAVGRNTPRYTPHEVSHQVLQKGTY